MTHREALRALSLSDAMLRHLAGDGPPTPLDYRCQTARAWRSSPIAKRDIVPLWECGMMLDYYNRASGRFERCSLENIDEICCSYSSLQGLLAELFLNLYEDGMEDACLYACASQFGFHEVARMLVELQSDKATKDYARWRTSWGASCVDVVR